MGQARVHYARRSRSRGMRMQSKSNTSAGVRRRQQGESLISGKKYSFIISNHSVLELCRFNGCSVRTLGRQIMKRKIANLKHIQAVCEPLYVDYRKDDESILADDISALGANRQKAFGRHRCTATVEQYLFSRYKRTLRFSDLPCICAGANPDYYPLECLRFNKEQPLVEDF